MTQILCLNGGSSSLKFGAYDIGEESRDVSCTMTRCAPFATDALATFDGILAALQRGPGDDVVAVGHRIVFGGPRYALPIRANVRVLSDLEDLVDIEPLHLRAELNLVYAAARRLPEVPQVLCFDTGFHRRAPAIARRLPLPQGLDPLLERYGFHGLSYEYVSSQLGDAPGATVIAHLGSGASLCALRDGIPVETTMGFSALGGLMMGTRPGDLDPGILLRLLSDGCDLARLTAMLYRESGLLGVSGTSGDMKDLLKKEASDPAASQAVELFVYQLIKHIGAMVAVLGGLQTLVFTGGIGERAPEIRARACASFEYLGLQLDEAANRQNAPVISNPQSLIVAMVVPTDENLMIARHTLAVLAEDSPARRVPILGSDQLSPS
jgi:acetate kinase